MTDSIFGFLNENSNAILAVFSIVIGVTTIVYARITWRMFSETKKMREAQTEPNISASIISKEGYSYLKDIEIQNIGLGPAYNIKFEVTPDFKYTEKKMFSELNIIKNGIKYLAPNQKIQFFLANIPDIIQNKKEVNIKIEAKYKNKLGKPYDSVFEIDFSEYFDMRHIGKPPLIDIAEDIKKIGEHIRQICIGSKHIKVITCMEKDIKANNDKFLEQIKQLQKKGRVVENNKKRKIK